MFLINLFTTLANETPKGTPAPFKPHAECNRFDRFMNVVCFKLGLIRELK